MIELEVGDIVMCTVEKVERTIVFVKIDGYGDGSIIMSEIAPGRIRNIRDYVVPKKRIICKVIRLSGNRIDLSLRRVTPKEQKEIREKNKQEKSFKSILKTILKDKSEKIIQELIKTDSLYDFFQETKENPKKLEKLVGKTDAKKIIDILKTQKKKKAILKKEISLTTTKADGIKLIKEILGNIKDAKVKYISAGRYSIQTESDNMKEADNKLKLIFEQIEKQTKQKGFEFSVKEK
jgi:translation initiation factor 2 alpha subunit (eIF-2alpha)